MQDWDNFTRQAFNFVAQGVNFAVEEIVEAVANEFIETRAKEHFYQHVYQGDALSRQGDYQGALEEYNQALKEEYNQVLQFDLNFVLAYNDRSLVRHALGDNQGALEDCNMAFQLALPLDEALAYYERSLNRHALGDNLGNNQRAIEDLTQTLHLKPNYIAAYYIRGNGKYDLGDEAGAFQEYNQAQAIAPDPDIDPKDEHGYYGRALARARMGDNVGALEDLNTAATLCSEHRNTALHQRVQEMIATL